MPEGTGVGCYVQQEENTSHICNLNFSSSHMKNVETGNLNFCIFLFNLTYLNTILTGGQQNIINEIV